MRVRFVLLLLFVAAAARANFREFKEFPPDPKIEYAIRQTAEKVLKESVETLKAQTRAYTDNAGEHFDEAQRYVVERVKERPVTATLAGLGVGLLLGLLLANRSQPR